MKRLLPKSLVIGLLLSVLLNTFLLLPVYAADPITVTTPGVVEGDFIQDADEESCLEIKNDL